MNDEHREGWVWNLPTRRFGDIPGFEVAWAGASPSGEGFCYGSEDGRILLDNESEPRLRSDSCEAINGMAAIGPHMVVSTRVDWTLWRLDPSSGGNSANIPGGTHGVIGAPNGYFVGPMGAGGLRVVQSSTGHVARLALPPEIRQNAYFYTCHVLGVRDGKTIILCSARHAGLAIVPLLDHCEVNDHVRLIGHEGWDVIDACSLSSDSFAAAALGKNGTIRLFNNVVEDRNSTPLGFSQIRGVPYRIASCNGHLIVMTSEMVCILDQFSTKYLNGDAVGIEPAIAQIIPVKAIDLTIIQNHILLVVSADNTVIQCDLAKPFAQNRELKDAFHCSEVLEPARGDLNSQLRTEEFTLSAA